LKRVAHAPRIARTTLRGQGAEQERPIQRAVSVVVFGHLDAVDVDVPSVVNLAGVIDPHDDVGAQHLQSRHARLVHGKRSAGCAGSGGNLGATAHRVGRRAERSAAATRIGCRSRAGLVRRWKRRCAEGIGGTRAIRGWEVLGLTGTQATAAVSLTLVRDRDVEHGAAAVVGHGAAERVIEPRPVSMESGALAALGEADMALREGAEHEVFEHSRSGLRRPGLQQEAAETRNGPGTACREQGGEIGASLEQGPDRHGIGATTELRQVGPGLVGNGAAVGDRESVEASEQPEVIVRTLPRGRALDAVATRAIPLVRREDGGAAAADKRGDQENVVVYVNAGERSIGIEGDILLEEPGSDVGVSIDGETVAAHHHHLISA